MNFLAQIFLPYQSLIGPIDSIINAPVGGIINAPVASFENQIAKWKETTLFELQFIGLVSALLAGVVTSALAWPVVLPWSVKAFWLASLLLAVISLTLAAQEAIALTRVWNSEHAPQKIRMLLGVQVHSSDLGDSSKARKRSSKAVSGAPKEPKETHAADVEAAAPGHEVVSGVGQDGELKRWRPSKFSLYVWQVPNMLLGNAVVIFVIGLAIWVYSAARTAGWGDEGKIAVFFTVFLIFAVGNYCATWWGIERLVQNGFGDEL